MLRPDPESSLTWIKGPPRADDRMALGIANDHYPKQVGLPWSEKPAEDRNG